MRHESLCGVPGGEISHQEINGCQKDSAQWVMDPGQEGEERLWNIFPITSGMLLHCWQPSLAGSGFPGLVPHHNKSRSCSHPRPPRGANLNQELLEPKKGTGAVSWGTAKPATCWSSLDFPSLCFCSWWIPVPSLTHGFGKGRNQHCLLRNPTAFNSPKPHAGLWSPFWGWFPAEVSQQSPSKDANNKQLHVSLCCSRALLYPSCPLWHNVHLHQSELYFWNEHEIAWNLSRNFTQATLLIMEQINTILCWPLWIIDPEKATEILSMASRACSISLDGLEQGCSGHLKGFGACFSNIGLRCGCFLIKPFFWWESWTSDIWISWHFKLGVDFSYGKF